ncbi:MAG: hypothetical protein P1U58_20425 [Verrucomicrobiales bacterium]|nr:hypothetical protein [Verrucomicrobiales bacterium]
MGGISKSIPLLSSSANLEHKEILSTPERIKFAGLELKIRELLLSFIDIGEALECIRKNRLYREEFDTFEQYCCKRWNFSRQRAYQLIEAAKVADYLSTNVDTWPSNEAQVRPLIGQPYDEVVRAWKLAEKLAGKKDISGRLVKEAVVSLSEKYSKPATEKTDDPKTAAGSLRGADKTLSTPEGERNQSEMVPDHEAVSNLEVPPSQTTSEKSNIPGTSFELADGSVSAEHYFNGEDDLLSADYLESKLKSTKENNANAPQHLRVEPEVLAMRQDAFLELASAVNRTSGASPSPTKRDQIYWAVHDLQHLTAFLRPVTSNATESGKTPDGEGE